MRLVYDGWALVYAPNSPAALHTLTLLEAHPPEIEAWAALPGASFHPLVGAVRAALLPAPDTQAGRLRWEQRSLPDLARKLQAHLHLSSSAPPLFGSAPVLVSPAVFLRGGAGSESPAGLFAQDADHNQGMAGRLRLATVQGGFSRTHRLFWPDDLPALRGAAGQASLPPAVHPAFAHQEQPDESLDMAEEMYILYHGPTGAQAVQRLVEAWRWVSGALNETVSLVIAGLEKAGKAQLEASLAGSPVAKTVRILPPLSLAGLAALYRGSRALFHPAAPAVWGDPVRHALACGKAVVGLESAWMEALVGPAAYLAAPGNAQAGNPDRALGAALISVALEDSLAGQLAQAARQRSAGWRFAAFAQALGENYRALAGQL
jgi:hypothetical protein